MCRIPQLLLIRVSGANITLDYRVRSYLLLTTVSDSNTSLDQFARYWNYCWSEFLVQTLLLIIGSDQNYYWPESPEQIFFFISMPEITPVQSFWCKHYTWSKVTPDQSFWCKHYSWLEGPIIFTPDHSLRYLYFSWSMSPIPKLLLIRVSGANITVDYRVPSNLLETRVFDTNMSLDKFAWYRNYSSSEFFMQTLVLIIESDRNYSWPESPINIFLLISVPDTKITPDQSLRYTNFSWSVCPIPKLLLVRVSGANITLDFRVLSKLLQTRVSDKYISLDQCAWYKNYTWSESPVHIILLISVPDREITPDQSFWCYITFDYRSCQIYSWSETPINIFLLISVPDTEITPDQSF